MSKEFRVSRREFLNMPGHHSDASVSYDLHLYGGSHCYMEGSFKMRDCDRPISLELEVDSEENLANSIEKLNRIAAMCKAAKADLRKIRKKYIQRKAEHDAAE